MAKFNNKQEVCEFINKKLGLQSKKTEPQHTGFDWFINSFLRPKKVHVPIYTTEWKINFIKKLQRKIYYDEEMSQEGWCSSIDFSKIIWADEWKTFPFTDPIALPKFTKEHEHFWVALLEYEFFQENLEFGVRPISVYRHTIDMGGGQLVIINKSNNDFYLLDKSQLVFLDWAIDFEEYLKGEETKVDWGKCKIG